MQIGMKVKGTWNENQWKWISMKDMKRPWKGTWKEMNAQWYQDACKWMQHERSMKCCGRTWNQQSNCSIHFRSCFGLDLGFMLDLEYVDFPQTLGSDRATPKSDNHNNSRYSDVKEFDRRSCVCIYIYFHTCMCMIVYVQKNIYILSIFQVFVFYLISYLTTYLPTYCKTYSLTF